MQLSPQLFATVLLLLALSPGLTLAQIKSEAEYQAFEPICLDVTPQVPEVPPGAKINALWRLDSPAQFRRKNSTEIYVWAPPRAKRYQVQAIVWITRTVEIDGIQGDLMIGPPQEFNTTFTVLGDSPEPDPKPDPKPDPDDPDPEPQAESPFEGEGLRGVIIYEIDDIGKYDKEHVYQLYAEKLRNWTEDHCAHAADGSTEFRILDQNAISRGTQWGKVLARPRTELPWLVIGNGKTGYEGPLPLSIEDTIAKLEKFLP